LVDYVSSEPIAPIYGTLHNDNLEYRERATDTVIASSPFSLGETPDHDFFVIQFMRDPSSGSLILNAQGFWQSGTTAAAFYFDKAVLPSLGTQDKSWYVYEWTDANADHAPDLNEITLVGCG
jgi:hypothetical protein